MKKWMLMFILVGGTVFAESRVELMDANSWDSNKTHQVVWETTPGVRYELQSGTSLTNLSAVSGYPSAAGQYSDSFSFNTTNQSGFFRVVEYDEQAPAITEQNPDDGAFAVRRFSDVSIELSDISEVNTNSIALTVGDLGTFSLLDSELSYTNGTLAFSTGGDTALGGYGSNVTVSLAVADVNGYAETNSWSFDLEVEPLVESNLFVFGSPDAQRAGQRIGNIPTRILAQRAAGGPIRMSGGSDAWIVSVETNLLLISYTASNAPAFSIGQYVANMTPSNINEIFYREVTSISNDLPNKQLTLFTEDVRLTDIVSQGAISLTEESYILEVSTNGVITAARAVQKAADFTIPLPRIGYSLDGETYSVPSSGPASMTIEAEECHFWLDPRLEIALEVDQSEVEQFKAIAYGDVESALVYDLTAQAGASVTETLYDLPQSLQPKTIVMLGYIGAIPVFAEVGVDLQLDADLTAAANLNFRCGFRQDIDTSFGILYEDQDVKWVKTFAPEPTEIIPLETSVNGELGLGLTLQPTIYVVVLDAFLQHCAGVETGPAVRGGIRFENEDAALAGYLEGQADWTLGTRGWVFDLINPSPSYSKRIWNDEWKLFPDEVSLTFVEQPENRVLSVGESAHFSCTVSPDDGVVYQWFHNGVPLVGDTRRTLLITDADNFRSGDYHVAVDGKGAQIVSDPASLIVTTNRYLLVLGDYTWHEAKADAESRGGHLATVTSAEEWQQILNQFSSSFRNYMPWLGGTDEGSEGEWRWVTNEPWSFDAWNSGEPNNANRGREHYLHVNDLYGINAPRGWNDTLVGSPCGGYILELE